MTLFMNKTRVSSTLWVSFIAVATFMSCSSSQETAMVTINAPEVAPLTEAIVPTPDPRIGLDAGLFDAEEAVPSALGGSVLLRPSWLASDSCSTGSSFSCSLADVPYMFSTR